ncbi:MAG: hypothetical protein HC887_09935 [Desulfobacteraceae bacterium]|nr:hypothetical protein [Desulfobacteraceae bacterium]
MKRKFLYCFCLLIIFTMTGCGGESSCNNDFLPLAVGNKWVYDVREKNNMYSGAYSDLLLTDTTCSALTYTIEIVSESEEHYTAAYRKEDAAGSLLEEKALIMLKKKVLI